MAGRLWSASCRPGQAGCEVTSKSADPKAKNSTIHTWSPKKEDGNPFEAKGYTLIMEMLGALGERLSTQLKGMPWLKERRELVFVMSVGCGP